MDVYGSEHKSCDWPAGRQVEDKTQTVSRSCTPIKKRTHSNLCRILLDAAVIMTGLLALAPECVWC